MRVDLACGHRSRSLSRKYLKHPAFAHVWCPVCRVRTARVGDHGPKPESTTNRAPKGQALRGRE